MNKSQDYQKIPREPIDKLKSFRRPERIYSFQRVTQEERNAIIIKITKIIIIKYYLCTFACSARIDLLLSIKHLSDCL